MKKNYQPWEIDLKEFPEKNSLEEQLSFLINFAILAPSGHNSQPWEFSIENNEISIWVNEERSLSKSDPERRQLLIAIGCALENLLIAADYYGFQYEVKYLPEQNNASLIARISFSKERAKEKNDTTHLIFSIPNRCTNRNKYKAESPSPNFLKKITDLSNKEFTVTLVTDQAQKEAVSDIACLAQIEAMDSDSFREELSHYIKSNFTKEHFGMPGFTLGIPAPISLFAHKLIKKVNLSRKTRKKDEDLLKKYTPAIVIISALKDDGMHHIKVGQLFERIWLMAIREGLSCSPLAAPVQVSDYYQHLQKIAGIIYRPEVFFRMGYAHKEARHSPRVNPLKRML